jgi:PPOX class probable F420-dependent enzyme
MTHAEGSEQLRIDEDTEFGARAAHHLRDDPVVWLTTVSLGLVPAPNPVWFLWRGGADVLVFSLPGADRVRHLQAHPAVSLNFAGDGRGGDIVVLTGRAEPRPGDPTADQMPAYLAKYDAHIHRIGLTPQSFAERYSLPLLIRLNRLRGH